MPTLDMCAIQRLDREGSRRPCHGALRHTIDSVWHPSLIMYCELFTEKPLDLMSKTAIWSTYKHYNTVKYHPAGNRKLYISKGYAGRASDEYIPEDNGNLIKLQAGNVMLANWGVQCEG